MAATAAAATAVLAAPGTAGADTTLYPGGGSTFTGSAQGWTGSGGSCAPVSGLDITCSTSTSYSATEGRPPARSTRGST